MDTAPSTSPLTAPDTSPATTPFAPTDLPPLSSASSPEPLAIEEKSRLMDILLVVSLFLLVGVVGVNVFLFLNRGISPLSLLTRITSPTTESTDEVSPPTEEFMAEPEPTPISGVIQGFSQALYERSYKVTGSGSVTTKSVTDLEDGRQITSSYSILADGATFYLDNGSLVRYDPPKNTDLTKIFGSSTIIRDNVISALNSSKRTYTTYEEHSADGSGEYVTNLVKYLFPPLTLANNTYDHKITSWQSTAPDEWEASWNWSSPSIPNDQPVTVRIMTDPETALITSVSYQFPGEDTWQKLSFKYEAIGDIEPLLQIPANYKMATK